MSVFRLFSPTGNREQVADISDDVINISDSEQPYGSLDGDITVEVTSDNINLLRSIDEYSHYVKLSAGDTGLAGAVTKGCHIDKGIAYIKTVGFLEYMSDVPMIAEQNARAIAEGTLVYKDDPSWTRNIYSDSNAGLFFGVFTNLANTMLAQGWSPFFEMRGIEDLVAQSPDGSWEKSYRINTLEIPNVAQVYSDLTDDTEFLPIKVMVDDSDTFMWYLVGFSTYDVIEINEAVDDVKDVAIDRGDRVNRSMALATGTDPNDNNLISKISFNPGAAYSAAFNNDASKNVLNIARASRSVIAGANRRSDQITFTTWDPSIEIFSAIKIRGQYLDEISAVVTEKSTEGQAITYTAIIVDDLSSLIPGVKRPTSAARRLIYGPAKEGNRRAIRQGLEKRNPTGWR